MKSPCANCGATENLTKDHKIPVWIVKRISFFGLKKEWTTIRRSKAGANLQILCATCNYKKGGRLDYSIPEVRQIMTLIRDKITEKLNETHEAA